MRRHLLVLSALFVTASAASAATLTVTPDKTSYGVGETITLSIVGDSEGAAALLVSGFLRFDEALVRWQNTTQEALVSQGSTWVIGFAGSHCLKAALEAPGCPAFDQLSSVFPPSHCPSTICSSPR